MLSISRLEDRATFHHRNQTSLSPPAGLWFYPVSRQTMIGTESEVTRNRTWVSSPNHAPHSPPPLPPRPPHLLQQTPPPPAPPPPLLLLHPGSAGTQCTVSSHQQMHHCTTRQHPSRQWESQRCKGAKAITSTAIPLDNSIPLWIPGGTDR